MDWRDGLTDKELTKLIERREVEDVVTKLFVITDNLDWKRMLDEILGKEVYFDMRSLTGEEPRELSAKQITDAWEAGLRPLKAVNHLMGNLMVTVSGERAMPHATRPRRTTCRPRARRARGLTPGATSSGSRRHRRAGASIRSAISPNSWSGTSTWVGESRDT